MKNSWIPLTEDTLAAKAHRAVDDIAAELSNPDLGPALDFSLSTGTAGIALFFGALSRLRQDEAMLDLAHLYLERSFQKALAVDSSIGFFGGLSGLAWTACALARALDLEMTPDSTEDLDGVVMEFLDAKTWAFRYDLIYGLVGVGLYFSDHPEPTMRKLGLERALFHLNLLKIENKNGYCWHTPVHFLRGESPSMMPNGCYDLGIAHGIGGVIGLLSRAVQLNVAIDQAREMLTGAVNWLLSQRRFDDAFSTFNSFADESVFGDSSRSAWCYGDPGLSSVLFAAGRALGNEAWQQEAVRIVLRDAQRSEELKGVVDATLCHGSAGLMHIANSFYNATGDRRFERIRLHWLARTLAYKVEGRGVAGFGAWRTASEDWDSGPGFLTGAAGIGLALIAMLDSQQPFWDPPLLVDLPSLGV